MDKLTLFRQQIQTNESFVVIDGMDVSVCTREDYKQRIKYFLSFLTETTMDRDTLLRFKRELENRADLGAASKNKYLTAARVYLKELYRTGKLPVDLSEGVKAFKQNKGHKKFGHTEEEIKKIINELRLYNLRDKAIMYLLIFQGLRQVELVRLEIQDVDIERGTIMVQGKGKDDKELMTLHSETLAVLKAYMKNLGKKEGKLIGISERMIRNIHAGIVKKLGIKATTHGTRHFYTTNLLKAFEGDVLTVQKFTRHGSVEMLQVYNDDIDVEKNLPKYEEAFNNLK